MTSAVRPLEFPDSLIPRVLLHYARFDAHPMPDASTLGELIRLAFYASLEREEGRPVTFSLGLMDPTDFGGATSGWSTLRFEHRRPATVAEVVRLAPATDSRQTVIALHCSPAGLELGGIAWANLDNHRMETGENPDGTGVVLWYPRVTATGPGRLTVGIHDADIASFSSGTELGNGLNVLRSPGPVVRQINALAEGHLRETDGSFPKGVLERVLGHILQRVARRGHGGTIAILPSCDVLSGVDIKYAVGSTAFKRTVLEYWRAERAKTLAEGRVHEDENGSGEEAVDARLERYRAAREVTRHWPTHQLHLHDAISALADLASVDGAVILGPDLSVSGFGAMFRWGDEPVSAVRAISADASETEPLNLSEFGSRHRSAAAFCAAHSGAVVFIVSEDGPVSCMLRPDPSGALVLWRPMSLSWRDVWYPPPRSVLMNQVAEVREKLRRESAEVPQKPLV